MKHPALARVFSIVLAVLSLFMLLNGAVGFKNATVDREEALHQLSKLDERTERYIALEEELAASISYEQAEEQLEAFQEKHNDTAAQHRTDLATHTATEGGYEMGAKLIQDGKVQVESAKSELASAQSMLTEKKAQLDSLTQLIDQLGPQMEELLKKLEAIGLDYNKALAMLDVIIAGLEQQLGKEPSPPSPELTEPVPPTEPAAPEEAAPQEELDRYQQAMAQYEAEKAAYEQAMAEYASFKQQLQSYEEALASWKQDTAALADSAKAQLAQVAALYVSAGEQLSAALAQLPPQLQDQLGSPSGSLLPDFGDFEPEQLLQQLYAFRAQLVKDKDLPTAVHNYMASLKTQLAAAQQALQAAELQVAAGKKALEKAEAQLQHQLEMLWWNMGKLEDEKAELAESKEKLDDEALELDKMIRSTQELKDMENELRSQKLVLMQENRIKQLVDEGGGLVDSSRTYIQEQSREIDQKCVLMYLVNGLAVLGGLAGILAILSAYEKFRGKLMLIGLPALCLACAAGADIVNMIAGEGQMYTALFAAIGAALQLLIVIPHHKKTAAPSSQEQS